MVHANVWAEAIEPINQKEDVACCSHLAVTNLHRATTLCDNTFSMPNLESLLQCRIALK